jgi:hypothetical protein
LVPWKRKIILHKIEIASVIPCRRKIILHKIEIASVIPCRRKIILREIEIVEGKYIKNYLVEGKSYFVK